MEELFGTLVDGFDNPMVLFPVMLFGGGGIAGVMMVASWWTTGDVSDLVWGVLVLILQG